MRISGLYEIVYCIIFIIIVNCVLHIPYISRGFYVPECICAFFFFLKSLLLNIFSVNH